MPKGLLRLISQIVDSLDQRGLRIPRSERHGLYTGSQMSSKHIYRVLRSG
jgi:hypothetical protein